MPPARSATSAARTARAPKPRHQPSRAFRPRSVPRGLQISHVRWDRKFRTVMLFVLALVGWIGVHAMITLANTRAQAEQQQAIVHSLVTQNHRLAAEQRALNTPATIISDARALGMVRSGERAYAVTGLPGH